jgi:hypothetical protein
MIAVAQDALAVQPLWYREPLHKLGVAAMKPGVEYSDLGQVWHPLADQVDRRQFTGQMQRHEWH